MSNYLVYRDKRGIAYCESCFYDSVTDFTDTQRDEYEEDPQVECSWCLSHITNEKEKTNRWM